MFFLLFQVVLIVNFIDFTPLAVGKYVMPPWAQGLGWCMALVSVVMIPIFAIFEIYKSYSDQDYDGLAFHRVNTFVIYVYLVISTKQGDHLIPIFILATGGLGK